jgi:SAM-dependent methyltransferase
MQNTDDKTIQDFDTQWTIYGDNDGWYASVELFEDIISPLLTCDDMKGKYVAEIGSGTGRIVGMLLKAGAEHVYAIEPAKGAFKNLEKNITELNENERVTSINSRGDNWAVRSPLDYVFSIGVIQFIQDPTATVKQAFDNLKPGGEVFFWLYSHEGNELYLTFILPLRKISSKLPHVALRVLVEILYGAASIYRFVSRAFNVPLKKYIDTVWWPMTAHKRRLVIYDQLNPTYAKYHKKYEAIELLEKAGFENIQTHHRHGYSWCVKGTKPNI